MTSDLRQGLPRCDEAELSLIGAFLREGSLVRLSTLDPADFYSERHRCIFEAMKSLSREGSAVDMVTVPERLFKHQVLDVAGGPTYLMQAADSIVSTVGWDSWEAIIRDYALRRSCIAIARKINEKATEGDSSGAEMITEIQASLNAMSVVGKSGTTMFSTAVSRWLETIGSEKAKPLPTGFTTLDQVLHIRPGQLGVIAATPGCGKTSVATQIAACVSLGHGETLFNTLEMGEQELMLRILSQQVEVPTRALEMGHWSPQKDGESILTLQDSLDLQFCGCRTPEELRAVGLQRKAQGRLKLILVDYLQLMGPQKPTGNDVSDISYVTRSLKLLAGELDVPVIALSQLSRDAAKNGTPKLHHLRGSGSIEQDADWVLALYDEQQDAEGFFESSPYKLWELLKQRGGATMPAWRMGWEGRFTKFKEYIA